VTASRSSRQGLTLPTHDGVEQWKFAWDEWLEAIDSTV
jgi:hypothetical protein